MVYQRRLTPIIVARELRKNLTKEERMLWNELRNKKLNGYKFLRQHPIVYDSLEIPVKFYILDFYCNEKKVAIELDGEIHNSNISYDRKREFDIKMYGIRILRFKNHELKDMEEVKRRILEFLNC
jgi:very-short-patch-repair endonuclease